MLSLRARPGACWELYGTFVKYRNAPLFSDSLVFGVRLNFQDMIQPEVDILKEVEELNICNIFYSYSTFFIQLTGNSAPKSLFLLYHSAVLFYILRLHI